MTTSGTHSRRIDTGDRYNEYNPLLPPLALGKTENRFFLALDRHADQATPLGPGAIVVADLGIAEQVAQDKPGMAAATLGLLSHR
jgi:hypothetical protein